MANEKINLPESWEKQPYQIFDDLSPDHLEALFEALKEDIKSHAVIVPVELDEE